MLTSAMFWNDTTESAQPLFAFFFHLFAANMARTRIEMESCVDVRKLEGDISRFRSQFRYWAGILLTFMFFTTPLLPKTSVVPMWHQMLMYPAVFAGYQIGLWVYGDIGGAMGLPFACFILSATGIPMGDGFMTQPVQILILPMFASTVGGPMAAVVVFIGSITELFTMYTLRYVVGMKSAQDFNYDMWVPNSFMFHVFGQLFLGVLVPIAIKRLEAPINMLKQVAEENRKSDVTREQTIIARNQLAAFSHEVRTPLNVVHAMADLLLRSGEVLSEHYTTLIHLLHSCAQSLLVISNNVLDLSAIWANALTINPARFDVEAMLSEWIAVSRESAKGRGIDISYRFENMTQNVRFANFDEQRLKQTLHNVIEHTLRSTHEDGTIHIRGNLSVDRETEKLKLNVEISNPLESVTKEQQRNMFVLPFKDEASASVRSRVYLDMYIARKLITALGGTISCTPCHDSAGVTFSLTVSLTLLDDDESRARPLRILYADDEPANQFVMKVLLKDSGHTLDLADDGERALEMFQQGNGVYDTVLLDMNMPRMGGRDTAIAIRTHEMQLIYPRVPIAFISAAPVNQHDLIESGADFVLQKPCSKAHLLGFLASIGCRTRVSPTSTPSDSMTPSLMSPYHSDTDDSAHSSDRFIDKLPNLAALSGDSKLHYQSLWARVRARFRRVLYPTRLSTFEMAQFHLSCIMAFLIPLLMLSVSIFPSFRHFMSPYCQLPSLLIAYSTFAVYPLFTAKLMPISISAYSSIQTTLFLIWVAFSQAGYPSYVLYAAFMIPCMIAGGTNALALIVSVGLHTLVGLGVIYAEFSGLVTFPVMLSEGEIASRMLFFWPGSMFAQLIETVYMEWQRKRQVRILMDAHAKMLAKQRKVSNQQHAMLELSAHVSYDIRTPLNVVLGITDRLKSSQDLPDTMRQSAGVLDTAAGMLLLLLDNVVDAKLVDAGDQISLNPSKVNLHTLGKRIATMMAFYARGKKLKLLLRIGKSVPSKVLADELRLQQVIVNLLTNSIKFTTSGTVTVTIENAANPDEELEIFDATSGASPTHIPPHETAELSLLRSNILENDETDEDLGELAGTATPPNSTESDAAAAKVFLIRFSVADTGPGFDSTALTKLFVQYAAGVSSATRKKRGTGLGLYISQAIVRKFGGELKVRSVPKVGSRFYFVLPLITVPSKASLTSQTDPLLSAERSRTPAPSLRILCIEDAPEMQHIVRLFLADTPHSLELVSSAGEGLQAFNDRPFDVILLDQHLPDMSGPETAEKIRTSAGGRRVIIAAVTADTTEQAKKAAQDSGCDNFLSKPLSRSSLLNLLRGATDTLTARSE